MSRQWWSLTGLVIGREIRERSRAKSFRIVTVIMVLAVAAAVAIPAAVKGHHSVENVGVAGGDVAAQTRTVLEAAKVVNTRVRVVPFSSLAAAEAALRAGHLSVVLVGDREVLVKQRAAGGVNSSSSTLASAISQLGGLQRLIAQLPAGRGGDVLRAGVGLPVRGLKPPGRSLTTRLTGMGAVIVIYVFIFAYGMRITTGVSDEKSSRVVEVLLATVRPTQLLVGKVVGIGALALAQGAAMVLTFLVLGHAVGSNVVHGASGGVVAVGALWLVLGYALYCTAFAAAGSLITRSADAANVSIPILIPLIVAYSLSFTAVFGSASAVFKVLAWLPPTAPVAMTTLYAIGSAAAWQVAVSAAITIAATVLLARFAGLVYERAILRTGARVSVRQVLRAERV